MEKILGGQGVKGEIDGSLPASLYMRTENIRRKSAQSEQRTVAMTKVYMSSRTPVTCRVSP